MKIWLVPNSFFPEIGGVQVVVGNLAREFSKAGHRIVILTSKGPMKLKKVEAIDGIVIHRFSFSIYRGDVKSMVLFLIRFLPTMYRLANLFRRHRPDLVNLHYVDEHSFYILLLRYVFDFPLILSIHGSDVLKNPKKYKALSFTLRKLLKKADHVVSNSMHLLNEVERYDPQVKLKTTIIPNGIDLAEFGSTKDMKKTDGPYILSVGRLVKEKGFDILLRAFRMVLSSHPEYRLIIIGDGIEKDDLHRLAICLGLSDTVQFLGEMERKEVGDYISHASFLVSASRREAFGMTLIEAMAAGKAVIATNVGGVPEIVAHGENGIIVHSEDPNALAEAILALVENPELREKLGKAGEKMVSGRFEWNQISNKYLEIFNRLVTVHHRQ